MTDPGFEAAIGPDPLMLHDLAQDLARDEGIRLKPYRCSAGKLTIGIGRNLEDLGITETEAYHLLDGDILRVVNELDKALPWWRGLTPARQRALANLCFALGLPKLLLFKQMLGALKVGNYQIAAAECLDSKWADETDGKLDGIDSERAERIAKLIREG